MSKIFDKESFEANDKIAKNTVIQYVEGGGLYDVVDNPGVGVDLIVYNKGTKDCIGYIEVERAATWWTYKGKYQGRPHEKGRYVRIPGRKKHFLNGKDAFNFALGREADLPHGLKPVMFATVNSLCTDMIFIFSDKVKSTFWEEEDTYQGVRKGSNYMCTLISDWSYGSI